MRSCRQVYHPRGIVQRLRHDFARSAVAFEFDQHQRTIGRDGQQVNAPAVRGDFLLADQHPFAGENARLAHDHGFQQLLAGELGGGQDGGLVGNLPDGVLDGHILSKQFLELINQRLQFTVGNKDSTPDQTVCGIFLF